MKTDAYYREQLRKECDEWEKLRSRTQEMWEGTNSNDVLYESELGYKLLWYPVTNSHPHLGMFTLLKTFLEVPSNFCVATRMLDVCVQ